MPGARERNSSTLPVGYSNIPQETLQKEMREQDESQSQGSVGPVSKENHLVMGRDLVMDPPLPENQERMKP